MKLQDQTKVCQPVSQDPVTTDLFSHQTNGLQKLINRVDVSNYMMMWFLIQQTETPDQRQKFYLKDLSQSFGITMYVMTALARRLQEKNLVVWKHDGNGEEGTYLQVTEVGMQTATDQRKTLERYRQEIKEQFGEERFFLLMREMSALEELMYGGKESEGTVYA